MFDCIIRSCDLFDWLIRTCFGPIVIPTVRLIQTCFCPIVIPTVFTGSDVVSVTCFGAAIIQSTICYAVVKAVLGRTRVIFLVHTDFPPPLGPETTTEKGCLKVIVVEEA